MDARLVVVRELQKHLLPGKKYKAFAFLEMGDAAKIFERIATEGFSSFVVEYQSSPVAVALAVEVPDRQHELTFERMLQKLAQEGLADIGLNPPDRNFR